MSLISRYRLSVTADTDGFNSLVASVVEEICRNTGLRVIDKISYGSDEFNGFPIYNKKPDFANYAALFADDIHQSDVYILGFNQNNYCLVVNIFNGYLLCSLGCSLDYCNRYSELALTKYPTIGNLAPLSVVTRTLTGVAIQEQGGRYSFQVALNKNSNEIIDLIMASYKGSNSQGFKFISNGVESEWLLFTRDEEDNKYCVFNLNQFEGFSNCQVYGTNTSLWEGYKNCSLVIRFNDEIPLYSEMIVDRYVRWEAYDYRNLNSTISENSYTYKHIWLRLPIDSYGFVEFYQMARTNTLNFKTAFDTQLQPNNSHLLSSLSVMTSINPTNCVHNLPKLQEGQVYLRKMFAPDSNKKINYYLWYSPVAETPAKNSFYEIGNDVYLLSTPGCIGYAIKV